MKEVECYSPYEQEPERLTYSELVHMARCDNFRAQKVLEKNLHIESNQDVLNEMASILRAHGYMCMKKTSNKKRKKK